ncbi:MAG: glycosyltransferase family 2 protein [Rikenellaceae bacterium]|nr:glycosyltransferase family 2 protein [Rikenellaceae bacterium]
MAQPTPKVSIIVPCYNAESYLDTFFAGILADTYTRIELIAVNDGSSDGTEAKILSYRDRIEGRGGELVYICQENQGPAGAVSAGLKVFTGEYLIWADADDQFINDSIAERVAYMEQHPDVAMLITNFVSVYTDAPDRIVQDYNKLLRKQRPGRFFEDILDGGGIVGPPVYIVRSAVVRRQIPDLELFNNHSAQNYQLVLPICYGQKVAILPDAGPHYKYFVRPSSFSHTPDRQRIRDYIDHYMENMRETLRKIPGMPDAIREACLHKVEVTGANRHLVSSYNLNDKRQFLSQYVQCRKDGIPIWPKNRIRRIIWALPGLKRFEETVRKWR